MKRLSRILLDPDAPAAGGSGGTPPANPPAPAPAAAPEAATTVLETNLTEADAAELVRLRRERDEDGKKLKDRETRIAELEDENRSLKTLPKPAAAPEKKGWLEGATFFG